MIFLFFLFFSLSFKEDEKVVKFDHSFAWLVIELERLVYLSQDLQVNMSLMVFFMESLPQHQP